jgi:hypothetical protein
MIHAGFTRHPARRLHRFVTVPSFKLFLWSLPCTLLLAGCEVVGLTVIGASAGTATGAGASYSMDSIAYRTFTLPLDKMVEKTRATLKTMEFPIRWEEQSEAGLSLHAKGGNATETLEIEIDLERLSPQVTRMRVVASRGLFLKDSATATEIIRLTAKNAEDSVRGPLGAQLSDQPTATAASHKILK